MAITAQQVNELRKRTNVGMMECKKALTAANGDVEAAIEFLRKAGIMKAEEKAGRAANVGIIIGKTNGKAGVLIEFLCETDFVAKTAEFKEFGAHMADVALTYSEDGDVCAKLAADVDADLKSLIGKIKENMRIRRAIRWNSNGAVAFYVHTSTPYGTLVDVEGNLPADGQLLNQLCMHITAMQPEYICQADVPAEKLAKEREIALAQIPADKPEKMKEGIVTGKLKKWFSQFCLMDQPWLVEDSKTVAQIFPGLTVKRMVRWLAGEEVAD